MRVSVCVCVCFYFLEFIEGISPIVFLFCVATVSTVTNPAAPHNYKSQGQK